MASPCADAVVDMQQTKKLRVTGSMADETGFIETLGLEMDRQRPALMPIIEQTLDSISKAMLAEFENTEEDGGSVQSRIIATQVTVLTLLMQAMASNLPRHRRTITVNLIAAFALDFPELQNIDDAGYLDTILAEAREKRGGITV